ncbi:hypothetical protein ACFYZ8_33780 [Streptomyces sp. NPDC001668]|uniref:hypothetical protein n=1 Tax=Streptomyces sp. NPDC001668 TaxID=3364598 RepID=UPI003690FD4C
MRWDCVPDGDVAHGGVTNWATSSPTPSSTETSTPAIADRLAPLPRRALVLTHDSAASAELLAKTVEDLLSE